MSNIAPQDPLELGTTDLAELSRRFRMIRASYILGRAGPLPRYQEIASDGDAWFTAEDPPDLLLFVSHRWKSAHAPDPQGTQAAALRYFLSAIREVADDAGRPNRTHHDLRMHGVFQAALLLGVFHAGGAHNGPSVWHPALERLKEAASAPALGATILTRIGIWYDYTCIPQVDVGGSPLSVLDREILADTLRHMHVLVLSGVLLSLREARDDYTSRAWCAAELSVGTSDLRHLVLRTDLLGQRFTNNDLMGASTGEHAGLFGFRESLLPACERWKDSRESGWDTLRRLRMGALGLDEAEADRTTPLFTSPRPPGLFPALRPLLILIAQKLSTCSSADRMFLGVHLNLDMEDLIREALREVGLACSEPRDLVYVGLLILYCRHVGAPPFAAFYGACLRRWIDGKSLRLVRYREVRDIREMKVWWVFDDDSEAVFPAWVRAESLA